MRNMPYVRMMLRRQVGMKRGAVVGAGTGVRSLGVMKGLDGSDVAGKMGGFSKGERQNGVACNVVK